MWFVLAGIVFLFGLIVFKSSKNREKGKYDKAMRDGCFTDEEFEAKKQNIIKSDRRFSIILVVVAFCLLGMGILNQAGFFGRGGGDDRTCGVCGRSFSTGTSDSSSIARTGMCVNCYSNYNYAQELLGH